MCANATNHPMTRSGLRKPTKTGTSCGRNHYPPRAEARAVEARPYRHRHHDSFRNMCQTQAVHARVATRHLGLAARGRTSPTARANHFGMRATGQCNLKAN